MRKNFYEIINGYCRPHELKAHTNHRDFKDGEPTIYNVMKAVELSLWTVVLCTKEFLDRDLETFTAAVGELKNVRTYD